MHTVPLVLALLGFVPAFAMIGAAAALDADRRVGVGLAAGTFFGLVFAGVRGRWVDGIFGPEQEGLDGKADAE
jgi:hypothetical protein